ncbi:hypothetical protein HaLaN_03134 [Haematococcus lacustris]|uniref:Uncharacterized protein n=1 Tax=Haematococcus lacustris TaxID=44745 RepID=A0A699YMT0_HAELA|nr:hypothetical protein HaLaN_03134 [Haematococcus lacustris]
MARLEVRQQYWAIGCDEWRCGWPATHDDMPYTGDLSTQDAGCQAGRLPSHGYNALNSPHSLTPWKAVDHEWVSRYTVHQQS